MLFMVIENFRPGTTVLIGERFKQNGRMLPDGVICHASWMESGGARCFQIVESANPELLGIWTRHWDDLVDFEIIPVETSADYWAKAIS